MSKSKRMEKDLITPLEKKDLYQAAIENSPSGFAILKIILDQNNEIDFLLVVEVNQSFANLLRKEPNEIIGERVEEIMPFLQQINENWIQSINRMIRDKETLELQHHYDDTWIKISIFSYGSNYILIQIDDNSEEMKQLLQYITERKKVEEALYHDQLTGLYNRRYYEEELIRINNEANYPITLVMADLNGLKLTNDAFGHVFGDRLLITFANVLKKECRNDYIIARIGGDEFILLLPRTNSIQAEKIVNRIQSVLEHTMEDNINLSVSFGWKTKQNVNEEFEEIYKQAEEAMYRRKLLDGKSFKSDTLKLITKSLYEKSFREQLHCERVSTYCRNIGLAMGMNSDNVNELGLIGLLHDIGKVGINAEILNRNGLLSMEEVENMKRHPEIGYHILRSVNEFAELAECVLAHHERIDGKGYPKGLNGSQIPLKSKILHIAEAFEVMTGNYLYRSKLTITEAIDELYRNAGIQFDEVIVHIFVEKVLKPQ